MNEQAFFNHSEILLWRSAYGTGIIICDRFKFYTGCHPGRRVSVLFVIEGKNILIEDQQRLNAYTLEEN